MKRFADTPHRSPTKVLSSARARWTLWGVTLAALAPLLAWLLRGQGKVGRDGWFLAPHDPWPLSAWWLAIGSLVIFGGLALVCAYDSFERAKSEREARASLRMSLAALMVMSLAWNWSLLGPVGFSAAPSTISSGEVPVRAGAYNVLASQWSDVATEYLGAAYRTDDARQFSRGYAARWQSPESPLVAHVATHPPGAVLFYYACRRAVESLGPLRELLLALCESAAGAPRAQLQSELNQVRVVGARLAGLRDPAASAPPLPVSALATAALAAIFLASAPALAAPAVFILARECRSRANHDADAIVPRRARAAGLLAAGLWLLAPTVGLFAPTLDSIVALGAAWALACAALWKGTRQGAWAFTSGAVLGLASWISFGALTAGAVVGLWLLWPTLSRVRFGFRGAEPGGSGLAEEASPVRALVAVALGFGAAMLLLLLLFPTPLPRVFANAMAAHRLATLQSREYLGWLWLNPLIFAAFAGVPLTVPLVGALLLKRPFRAAGGAAWGLACSALAAMALISLAGSVRGEVERLWMFFLPPFCALAAWVWLGVGLPVPESGASKVRRLAPIVAAVVTLMLLQSAGTLVAAATLAPLVLPF
jgi:hypothetical protein